METKKVEIVKKKSRSNTLMSFDQNFSNFCSQFRFSEQNKSKSLIKKRGKTFSGTLQTMIRNKALALCRNRSGRLLDVGCGNGLFFADLQENGGDTCRYKLFGVDIFHKFLIETKIITDGIPTLIQGEMKSLPFKDNCFDVVICLNTLYNQPFISHVEDGLVEMMRVCKPSGHVIIDLRNKANPYLRLKYWWHLRKKMFPTMAYYIEDFQKIFERHGFKIVRKGHVGIPNETAAFAFVLEASSEH